MSIRVDNLSQKYGDRYILKDINVEIFPGEILGIIGPNGSGKSTLVKMIAGDFSSTYGLIKYEGISLNKYSLLDRAKYRSVVSQEQNIMFDFTVKEVIEMGIIGGYGLNFNSEVWKKFEIVIKTLGIDKYANRSIRTLSGGELQRVHLARALIQIWDKNGYPTPKYIFLDEPTSNLDIGQELRFLNFIKNEVKRGLGAAIIFHDLNLAAHFSDKILLLSRGYVLDFGRPEEILTPSLIYKAYGLKVKVQKKPFRLSYLH